MGVLQLGSVGHGQKSERKCVIQDGVDGIHILNSQELRHRLFVDVSPRTLCEWDTRMKGNLS